MEKLYKVREVAKILRVSHKTVYNWIELGHLRGIKLNKALRVPESALQEFIEKNVTTAWIDPLCPSKSQTIKNLLNLLQAFDKELIV